MKNIYQNVILHCKHPALHTNLTRTEIKLSLTTLTVAVHGFTRSLLPNVGIIHSNRLRHSFKFLYFITIFSNHSTPHNFKWLAINRPTSQTHV